MPRTRSAPAVDRPRRCYPPKDDPVRLALAGRIPDAALAALLGQTPAAVRAWRSTRTPPIDPCADRRIAPDLWPEVEALARAAGADLSPWRRGPPAVPAPLPPLDWQAPPTWGTTAPDGDAP